MQINNINHADQCKSSTIRMTRRLCRYSSVFTMLNKGETSFIVFKIL